MNLSNTESLQLFNAPILRKFLSDIELPLIKIISELNTEKKIINTESFTEEQPNEIIFSSSLEIKKLIDDVVKKTNIEDLEIPVFFKIYNSNNRVKEMCGKGIDIKRISRSDKSLLKEIETIVYKNIKYSDINLYDLSSDLLISERQLHRKINSLIHLTPNKYIRILKLHKAKEYLDDYVYETISEVSYAVGYNDQHYFSKLFNSQYGINPKKLLISLH